MSDLPLGRIRRETETDWPVVNSIDRKDVMKHMAALTYVFVALTVATTPAFASDQKKALEEIASFAERICNSAPVKNGTEELELSIGAKAELTGLLKKVADLGVTGAAKYKKVNYVGVLQTDIAKLLSKDADCKRKISDKLIDKLIPGKPVQQNIISKESDCDGNPIPSNTTIEIIRNGTLTTITEKSGGGTWVRTVDESGGATKVSCATKQ